MLQEVTFIIKTFKRYDCLDILLKSIKKFYPEAIVIIADDNNPQDYRKLFYVVWKKLLNLRVLKLPFDSGLSFGRNKMVEHSNTKYIFLLDDDFIFTEKTDLSKFYKILESNENIGVVGGVCLDGNGETHYESILKLDDGVLKHLSDGDNYQLIEGIKTKQTGCILNFALFRKDVFNDVKWDDDLKLAEHLDFYFRLGQTKWQIYYTPEVKIIHARVRDKDYMKYRARGVEFTIKMFNKHGIKRMITIEGKVTDLITKQTLEYSKI